MALSDRDLIGQLCRSAGIHDRYLFYDAQVPWPRTATFIRSTCAGRPRSAKTKKCDPSHSLFAKPAPIMTGEELDRRPICNGP